jgi:hypothetical protein
MLFYVIIGKRKEMNLAESKAEVYIMALQSLSRVERKAIIARLLEDESLRHDIIDLAVIRERQCESARPFRAYVAERKKAYRK